MTTYYVGIGGNNANAGTSWALRKLTLNGAEDIPLVAGDTVYVGPGTYRELLTVDVSGTAGNPITYIGDYTGANTDGVGGVVRVTGSDNDQTATRANCITATSRSYRTFSGFLFDLASGNMVNMVSTANWIIEKCAFYIANGTQLDITGATSASCTIQNCLFYGHANQNAIRILHTSTLNDTGHIIQNCIFLLSSQGLNINRTGGITVKNCGFLGRIGNGVLIGTALAAGQTVTVNNCIFQGCITALSATVTGEIVENYNTFFGVATNRTNTATGANSIAYPALNDSRWFFQLTHEGAGPNHATQVITPFDLSSFSALLNVAGTSPTTADMRGTTVQGAEREWGALEYDSTLKIEGAAAGSSGGGPLVGGRLTS